MQPAFTAVLTPARGGPTKISVLAAATAALLLAGGASQAQGISYTYMFFNVGSLQTGDGNVLVDNGSFFSIGARANGSVPFSGGSISFGGLASPLDLSTSDGTSFGFQSGGYASKGAMDIDFPPGAYHFSLQPTDPGALPSVTSLAVGAEHYAASGAPYLTGTSYSALQGMDAAQPVTLNFSPFVTNSGAASSFIYLTIYDNTSNNWVLAGSPLSASTNSMILGANLLEPGHSYAYELDYSSRVQVGTTGTDFNGQIGYEMRTTGLFATAAAVPEPAVWQLAGLGLGLLACAGRRRQRGA
jgi:hypothetical protein